MNVYTVQLWIWLQKIQRLDKSHSPSCLLFEPGMMLGSRWKSSTPIFFNITTSTYGSKLWMWRPLPGRPWEVAVWACVFPWQDSAPTTGSMGHGHTSPARAGLPPDMPLPSLLPQPHPSNLSGTGDTSKPTKLETHLNQQANKHTWQHFPDEQWTKKLT